MNNPYIKKHFLALSILYVVVFLILGALQAYYMSLKPREDYNTIIKTLAGVIILQLAVLGYYLGVKNFILTAGTFGLILFELTVLFS